MLAIIRKSVSPVWVALILAIFSVSALFLWQGHDGLNLWDEGFLWYGAQRVMQGSVPVRDFMAYDPGRYYWSAAFMRLFGDDGIVSLRVAVAIFQILGLWVALLIIIQQARFNRYRNIAFLLVSAAIFLVWAIPRHKLFDISLSLFLLGGLTYLICSPVAYRYFVAGLIVGLAAFFGRNHGLYGALASVGVILWLGIGREIGPGLVNGFLLWVGGVITGYLPMFALVLFVPGFFEALCESVRFLFEIKSTNLPLPVPWPWLVNFSFRSLNDAVVGILVGSFFVGLLIFDCLALGWIFYQRFQGRPVPPAVVAAAFLSIPYTQFAYSRADAGHLAQGIFPALLGCIVILSSRPSKIKWPLVLLLLAASVWAMHGAHPGGQCRVEGQCVDTVVHGDHLKLDPASASDVALLESTAAEYAPHGRNFLVTPFWPGAYPILGQKAPVWEIYALFPRSEAFERGEIGRIKASNPGFILVVNLALDGNENLRFKKTHPLTYAYIVNNFERVPYLENPAYEIYKDKN